MAAANPTVFRACLWAALAVLLAACAGQRSRPDLPYPAFVDAGEIEEQFLATLPGVRARAFYGDPRTRALSSRVDLPADWSGSTAGEPGKALEIYVLEGELRLSDFTLGPGGYAWVPPGSLGFKLISDPGAQILYFLDELDDRAVMRAPVILDSTRVPWQEVGPGVFELELRRDPGTGARTWLRRIDAGTGQPWQASSVEREGYLLSGQYTQSECAQGEPATWDYLPGSYFRRPAGALSGGPAAVAVRDSTWFLREKSGGHVSTAAECTAVEEPAAAD
jgi:hypothetical protein